MATDGASTESTFPEADVDKALNPAPKEEFEVDPVSSDIATSKEIQQEHDEAAQKKEKEKLDALQKLKTTIFVSVIIMAVAGAAFAITKKLREK